MRGFLVFLLGAAGVAFIVTACGSETTGSVGDAGPTDALANDASNDVLVIVDASGDADPPADGPFACGSATCGATQYCVQPCCGGAPPPPDAEPCTPPPAYCIDDPSKAPVGCMKQGHGFTCLCA